MNQKVIIAILGVVVIILAGTTIYFATINKVNQPIIPIIEVQQPANNQVVAIPKPTPIAGSRIHLNRKYGFQISLTDNWKNYETEIEIGYEVGLRDFERNDPDRKRIKFCLQSRYKECLFAIDILDIKLENEQKKDIALCEKEQKDSGVAMYPCDTKIGRNDRYIFLGKVIVQDSTSEGSIALGDVYKIFNSFQLIE